MKRVLLVATTTGYQIRSFGEAAGKLGVRLVFASDRCDRLEDPWWDQAIPVRFQDPAGSVAAVVAACSASPITGIVAVGDRPAVLAAHIGRAMGLPGHPPEAAAVSRNKLATRMAFGAAGLATPAYLAVPPDVDPATIASRVQYPVVVKPLALSGSRGVVRADTVEQLIAAMGRVRQLLLARDIRSERDDVHEGLLVESFIPGDEYAVEGLLHHGQLQVLTVIDKPDPLDGPFFEETIYRMPSEAPAAVVERIVSAVEVACAAVGLHHGSVHAECRVDRHGLGGAEPNVYPLEVAARPIGGLCSRALRFRRRRSLSASEDGHDTVSLEEVLLRHALGEDVSGYERESDASGVMMIPIPKRGIYRGVDGLEEAKAVVGVEEIRITAKPDTALVPLPEGRSYLGFIFARGGEASQVDRALRDAHARLHFVVERELAVL